MVIISVWLGVVLKVVGQDIGPRFLILTCNDIRAEAVLEEATEYLKAAHIPYTLQSDEEEAALLLQREKAEPYIKQNVILKEASIFTIIESSELELNGYEVFTTSQEPIGIRVDVATENIKTVIQKIGDLEIPISSLPKQYRRLIVMPKNVQEEAMEQGHIEQEVVDISRFNHVIRGVMIIAIIAFIYFIREGRKREKKKFYKKGNI